MATITSIATGNWNVGSTWVGGVAPISSDDVVIANTHVVTLTQSESIAGIVVNSGGELDKQNYALVNTGLTDVSGTYKSAADVLGAEEVTNGDMELTTNWVDLGSPTTNERSNTRYWEGAYSRHVVASANNGAKQFVALTIGKKYLFEAYVYVISGVAQLDINDSDSLEGGAASANSQTTGKWEYLSFVATCDIGSSTTLKLQGVGAFEAYWDNVSIKEFNGLYTAGLTFNSGSSGDLQDTSLIYNSSDFSSPNEAIFTTNIKGHYIQTGNGNYKNISFNNRWYNVTINAGVTLTCNGQAYFSGAPSNNMIINGIPDIANQNVYWGCSAVGSFTLGASADIQGTTGIWRIAFDDASTFTWNKTSALSMQGIIRIEQVVGGSLIPMIDAPLADINISGSTTLRTYTATTGTNSSLLKCIDYKIIFGVGDIIIDNTANSSMEISGDIDFYNLGTTQTLTYTKGATAVLNMTGSSGNKTFNFKDKSIEPLVVNCLGATKEIKGDVRLTKITGIAGRMIADSTGAVHRMKAA